MRQTEIYSESSLTKHSPYTFLMSFVAGAAIVAGTTGCANEESSQAVDSRREAPLNTPSPTIYSEEIEDSGEIHIPAKLLNYLKSPERSMMLDKATQEVGSLLLAKVDEEKEKNWELNYQDKGIDGFSTDTKRGFIDAVGVLTHTAVKHTDTKVLDWKIEVRTTSEGTFDKKSGISSITLTEYFGKDMTKTVSISPASDESFATVLVANPYYEQAVINDLILTNGPGYHNHYTKSGIDFSLPNTLEDAQKIDKDTVNLLTSLSKDL